MVWEVREGMGGYGTVWGDLGAFEGGTGWYGTGFPRKFLNRPVASTSLVRGILASNKLCRKNYFFLKNMPKSPKTHGIAPEHIFSSVPQCPTTFFRFLRGEKCKMKQNSGRFTGFRFLLRSWQLAQKKFFFSNFFGVQAG